MLLHQSEGEETLNIIENDKEGPFINGNINNEDSWVLDPMQAPRQQKTDVTIEC